MCTIATTKSCSWFMVDLPLTPALNLRDTVVAFIFFVVKCSCALIAFSALNCLQCFDAVGWAAGRASGL